MEAAEEEAREGGEETPAEGVWLSSDGGMGRGTQGEVWRKGLGRTEGGSSLTRPPTRSGTVTQPQAESQGLGDRRVSTYFLRPSAAPLQRKRVTRALNAPSHQNRHQRVSKLTIRRKVEARGHFLRPEVLRVVAGLANLHLPEPRSTRLQPARPEPPTGPWPQTHTPVRDQLLTHNLHPP